METTTAFDLNRAIQQWRENLAQSPAFRSENLDELESHLRDSTDILVAKGLSEDEAFVIAVRRCGNRQQLQAEFAKPGLIETWFFRVVWILVGFLAVLNGCSFLQGEPEAWGPFHLWLPTTVLLILGITGLNAFLLRLVCYGRNRSLMITVLYWLTVIGFTASLVLACGSTFEILSAALLSRDATSPFVTAQTLSGIWFSYGFVLSEVLILVLLLAHPAITALVRKRPNRKALTVSTG